MVDPRPGTAGPLAAVEAETEERERTDLAPRVRVLLHDDPRTPMDFVVRVLREVFGLPALRARGTMLEAHRDGLSLVEVVPPETARSHLRRAHGRARRAGHPLTFTTEPA